MEAQILALFEQVFSGIVDPTKLAALKPVVDDAKALAAGISEVAAALAKAGADIKALKASLTA